MLRGQALIILLPGVLGVSAATASPATDSPPEGDPARAAATLVSPDYLL